MPHSYRLRNAFRLYTLILSGLICFQANAQQEKAKVDLVVYSATEQTPLSYATVSVMRQSDSTHVAYGLTDKAGMASFDGVRTGIAYNFLVFYMGYDVGRVPLIVTKDTVLDTLFLSPTTKTIDELVISAERPPLIIKNDTMEFNASAFKTLPDALVEDLLNKLPGVERDENGNLMVNGKKVTKLTVDGKVFFGSDPAIALKNLPANAIDKVQITKDADYENSNNPTGDQDETVVINLTIKKGMKKGYFGKVYAGGGMSPPDRTLFETGGIVNMFRDTFQVSIIGFGNNTNKQAFNYQELTSIGGFDRSGINRWYTSGSGVQIGNVSLGGALEGYNLASGGGINVNHNLERSYLNFQYFFGGNDANLLRDGYVIQSLRDSTLNMITATDNGSKVNNHRMSLEWQFDKDSLNELELGTNFSFYTDREQDRSFSTTRSEFHFLNSNEKETDRDYRNMEIEAYGSYNRLSKNDKWNNYIRGNVSRNYRVNNNLSTSVLSFTEMNGADSLLRQFRFGDEVQDRLQFYAFSAYDLLDSLTVSLTYRPVLIRLDKVNDTYDRTESEEKYDSSLSNRIGSQSALQELTAALTWVRPHFSVTPQLTILKYDQMNTYGLNDVSSSIHDMRFMPGIRFRIGDWRISYRIEYEQPEIDQLNPLLDNRSLSSQSRGNPNLNSEMKHEISLYTNHYNPETFVYYYLYASLNNYSTAIVESQAILENGVFFRTPVNVSDKLNGFGGGTIRKTYKYENKNSFTFAFSSWSSFERQPVIINNIQREFTSLNIRPNLMFELNLKDRFELSQLFSYRYRANTQPDRESLVGETINSSTSAILRWPGRFMWRVSYDLNYTKFNSEDVPVNEFYLFNAEVFYNIDEKGKWQLNLKAYDILNQNQRVNTYSNENYIYFSQSNVLQRYFLLTLVYNIKSFGGTEVSARDRNFWWW